jgi:hypothetical protein
MSASARGRKAWGGGGAHYSSRNRSKPIETDRNRIDFRVAILQIDRTAGKPDNSGVSSEWRQETEFMGGQGPVVQGSLRTCANSGTLIAQSNLKAKNKSRHEVPIEFRKRVVLQNLSKTKPDVDAIVCDMCWGKTAPSCR